MGIMALICALAGAGLSIYQGITNGIINLDFQNLSGEVIVLLVVFLSVPIAGIIGGIQGFRRKGGIIPLIYSLSVCILTWFLLFALSWGLLPSAPDIAVTPIMFLISAAIFTFAAIFAHMASQPEEDLYPPIISINEPEPEYEPITGVETEALIQRAYFFLEDGKFDDAGRYLAQAMNQDPEDSRIHLGKLMLENWAHNLDELIEILPTEIEHEKLFQRAMKFADLDEKERLEAYAVKSREYIAQRRSEDAAKYERERAEFEQGREQRYQEILALKDKASTLEDYDNLLTMLEAIGSYKDSDEIYASVLQAYENERAIEETVRETARRRTRRRIFTTAAVVGCAVIACAGIWGYMRYKEYADEQAREAEIAQAWEDRHNAITSFFEGRAEEAYTMIEKLSDIDGDPVIAQILGYKDNSGANVILDDEDISDYYEAIRLAEENTLQTTANKFLGDACLNGWGLERNYTEAAKYFTLASDAGDAYAQGKLAELYARGLGVDQDTTRAMALYKTASDNGNTSARSAYDELNQTIKAELDRKAVEEAAKAKARAEAQAQVKAQKPQTPAKPRPAPVQTKALIAAGEITGATVNVRSGSSTRTNAVNKLTPGTGVSISASRREADGEWYRVMTLDGINGWVRGDYVKLNNTQDKKENDKRTKKLPAKAVTTDRINVRDNPTTQRSNVLTVINSGTNLDVSEVFAGSDGDWYRVKTDNNEGWVFGKYIEFK